MSEQSLKQAEKRFLRILLDIRQSVDYRYDRTALMKIGEHASEIIHRRTRLGYGVTSSDARQKLTAQHAHSERYQKFRKENANLLSEFTSPKRQNLTFTGILLDDLQPINIANGTVTIGYRGFHKDGTPNEVIAARLLKMGYRWMGLTRPEQAQLRRFVNNDLIDKLKQKRIRASGGSIR